MTRMLVSVRSVAEALIAAASGADFIDLKEPSDGALGALPIEVIRDVVSALRRHDDARVRELPVSATIGDVPMHDLPLILARVDAVAACGVDYVKVGIEPGEAGSRVLTALGRCGHAIVPVLIADRGIDAALVAQACAAGFAGVMLDTAEKGNGSLFEKLEIAAMRGFVEAVRRAGLMAGLAGALRPEHVPALIELAPSFAGFRSAVCGGDRTGMLDGERVRALADQLRAGGPQTVVSGTSPSSRLRMRARSC